MSTRVHTLPVSEGATRTGTAVEIWVRNLDGDHVAESTPWGMQTLYLGIQRSATGPPLASGTSRPGRVATVREEGAVGDLVDPRHCSITDPMCARTPWDLYVSSNEIILGGGAIHGCPIVPAEPNAVYTAWGNWWTCRSEGFDGWVVVSFTVDGHWSASDLTQPTWIGFAPSHRPTIFQHTDFVRISCNVPDQTGTPPPCTQR
jgi:hypothetical protein